MNRQTLTKPYLWLIVVLGSAVIVLSGYHLSLADLDRRYFILALVTVLLGSRITIQIPGVQGYISVSDTFIFLTMLLYGADAAVLLSAAEALISSVSFGKRALTNLFNSGVMAFSTFLTVSILKLGFGDLRELPVGYTGNFIVALCAMALIQYGFNSTLIAVGVALKTDRPVFATWRKNFLWTSITYFAGASAAGIVAHFIRAFGFYAFIATTPIIAIIYFTYRTYLKNVETSTAQAEQARQHVEELSRHISKQERISKAFQESEEHFRSAFDYAAIGMALVSPEGGWLRVNRSLCGIVGYSEEELLVSDFQAVTHPEDLGNDLVQIYKMLAGEILTSQLEKRYIHKLGHDVWALTSASLVHDARGNPLHFIFQIQDITERKRAEAAIHTLSLVDELTGLYNRRGFLAFAKQYLNSVHRTNKGLMIVYADLDDLKRINDSFGHKEGDRALIKTAEILRETFRSSDIIARLGGDEYTVLATVEPDGGAESLIGRLTQRVNNYNARRTAPYNLSISIGVAHLDPEQAHSIEELMAQADQAMYENKRQKKTSPLPDIDQLGATKAVA